MMFVDPFVHPDLLPLPHLTTLFAPVIIANVDIQYVLRFGALAETMNSVVVIRRTVSISMCSPKGQL